MKFPRRVAAVITERFFKICFAYQPLKVILGRRKTVVMFKPEYIRNKANVAFRTQGLHGFYVKKYILPIAQKLRVEAFASAYFFVR